MKKVESFPISQAFTATFASTGLPKEALPPSSPAFINFDQWEDVDGDGQIVIGAEQWPSCLNPVTECANSSWALWTAAQNVLPGVWLTTNDGNYELSELMASEPKVEVKG